MAKLLIHFSSKLKCLNNSRKKSNSSIFRTCLRTVHSRQSLTHEYLVQEWERIKKWDRNPAHKSAPPVIKDRIFVNSKTDTRFTTTIGFDFDYTLANYRTKIEEFIYTNSLDYLVRELGYPRSLLRRSYNKDWAIRGLVFDRRTGNLMKLNQFYKISSRTIYNGHDPVPLQAVLDKYGGLRVSERYYEENMRMLNDLFCVPEGCLYSDVIQELKELKYDFHCDYISLDIRAALDYLHDGGLIHQAIAKSPDEFVTKDPNLGKLFAKLMNSNYNLFLLTNTSYKLIRQACEYLMEDVVKELGLKDWHYIFDWIMVKAKKPSWFDVPDRPFREFDLKTHQFVLSQVKEFKKNHVYFGGCLNEFSKLTGLQSHEVLYFGDNVISDLTGPFKAGQWKTCGIVRELEKEVLVNNSPAFSSMLLQLLDIENLLHDTQHLKGLESLKILDELRDTRHELRDKMKQSYNAQFGSIFRTHSTRTLYFHLLARYSDLYTSRVTNLLPYDVGHCFQPRRSFYDHETNYWLPDTSDRIH